MLPPSSSPSFPSSYPFPFDKAHALCGYLELALGANVSIDEPKPRFEIMRLTVERLEEKATLILYRKEKPATTGKLTPQGANTLLLQDIHVVIQAIKTNAEGASGIEALFPVLPSGLRLRGKEE